MTRTVFSVPDICLLVATTASEANESETTLASPCRVLVGDVTGASHTACHGSVSFALRER